MRFFRNDPGEGELVVLFAVIVLFSIIIAGGLFPKKFTPLPEEASVPINTGSCCDSGNGVDCHPIDTQTITFPRNSGELYGLLKSHVGLIEQIYHLRYSGEEAGSDPIIINTTNEFFRTSTDSIYTYVQIPNDEIIYVCKENCQSGADPYGACGYIDCYGNNDTIYDVYFKLSDYPVPGVPPIITNCNLSGNTTTAQVGRIMITPDASVSQDLQLKAFKIINIPPAQNSTPWISPWCKPAIYLYPETELPVNVSIKPQGTLTLTIPPYPKEGWNVLANTSGTINYQSSLYDYLYYEAQIPDNLIEKPTEGFIVAYDNLSTFFASTLPKLGLNKKEATQFSDYWLKALPKSPYYFVGIVSTSNLNTIAPLSIIPKPDTTIRVTLYFQALDEKIQVNRPTLPLVNREGFTAVEWGGIVKTDLAHPFSCFM